MKSLLCVKSVMTIMLTAMLCVMVYMRPDDYGDVFKNIVVMVATFYFSHQLSKSSRSDNNGMDNRNSDAGNGNTGTTDTGREG